MIVFIAAKKVETGKVYRIDRYDVESEVSACGDVDELLARCRSHLIRVSTREGTFRLTGEGVPAVELHGEVSACHRSH